MLEQPIDQSLQKIKFLFSLSGLNIEGRQMTRTEILVYLLHFFTLGADIVFNGIFTFYQLIIESHLTKLVFVIPIALVQTMVLFRTYHFIFYKKKVFELIKNIRELERTRLLRNTNGQKMVKNEKKLLTLVVNITAIVNVILVFLTIVWPLILMAIKYYTKTEKKPQIINEKFYSFQKKSVLSYVYMSWTVTTVVIGMSATDYFLYICCTHIKIQFMMLLDEMLHIIPSRVTKEVTTDLREKLSDVVKWHQMIISCAESLETIYSRLNLWQYVLGSLTICFFGFNTVFYPANSETGIALISFLAQMEQIFFLCLFGDMLTNLSTNLSTGVYNCKWYLTNVSTRKTLLIIMCRAQKPCKITARGFADVNLNTFVKILGSSWSYFALLQTLYAGTK